MKSLNGVAVVAAWSALAVSGMAVAQEAVQWRVEDGGNGHWYRFRQLGYASSWTAAQDEALQFGGHLATVTTSHELVFVSTLGPCTSCPCCGPSWFLGGFQADDAAEPLDGWQWVTGEPWDYAPWGANEPNDLNNEDYLYLSDACDGASFNDGRNVGTSCVAGVIEWSADCNGDGIVDYGQILDGTFADANENGVPDLCECDADINDDGVVNGADISVLLGYWGQSGKNVVGDITGDGIVNGADLAQLLGSWGECP